MPDQAAPASRYEQFTYDCIYKALPFRKAQWERWVHQHRTNYKLLHAQVRHDLALNDAQSDRLLALLREYL